MTPVHGTSQETHAEDVSENRKDVSGNAGEDTFGDTLVALLYRHGLKVALDVSEIDALRQTAIRSQSSEPVAWRLEDLIIPSVKFTSDREYAELSRDYRYKGEVVTKVTPLYTHPAPDASAVREGCVACEGNPKAPNNPCAVCGALTPSEPAGREELREKVAVAIDPGLDGSDMKPPYGEYSRLGMALSAADRVLALFQNTGRG